jgi:hypothetical protein
MIFRIRTLAQRIFGTRILQNEYSHIRSKDTTVLDVFYAIACVILRYKLFRDDFENLVLFWERGPKNDFRNPKKFFTKTTR